VTLTRSSRWPDRVSPRLAAVLSVLVLVGTLTWEAPPALAHGVLLRSAPPANASLPVPPKEVVLWFNEPLDPAFSGVRVLDRSGNPVSAEFSASEDRRRITVALVDDLPRGTYVVKWRALWPRDGHTTSGFFLFAVGEQVSPRAAVPMPGQGRVLARWLAFAAALLLTGMQLFALFVLSPAKDTLASLPRFLQSAGALAAVTTLLGNAGEFVLAAVEILDGSAGQPSFPEGLWSLLAATKTGWAALLRVAGAGLALLSLAAPGPVGSLLRLVAGWAVLAGFTLNSHASGRGLLAVLADWVHLLAAAALLGGWTSFLLALWYTPRPGREPLARAVLPRLSALFGVSLLVLSATGLYVAAVHVPGTDAFGTTAYGRLLLGKLLLVLVVCVLGAVNRYVLMPRVLASSPGRGGALRALTRTLGGELAVGAAILLTVAVLTLTPPPSAGTAEETEPPEGPLLLTGLAGEFQVRLAVAPAKPGRNRFEVTVLQPGGKPLPPETRIFLWVTKLDEELDPQKIRLSREAGGRYTAEGAELGLPGWWQVEVVVRRRGQPDLSTVFPLPVGEAPLRPTDPEAARVLQAATEVMARSFSWRMAEQVTDGVGEGAVTWYEARRPDRLRYRTSAGLEGIIVGRYRYVRFRGGPWRRDVLPQPPPVESPLERYTQGAEGVFRARTLPCGEEACQVVLWEVGSASFAALLGERTRHLHRLLMVAPAHYMTLHSLALNVPVSIQPPE